MALDKKAVAFAQEAATSEGNGKGALSAKEEFQRRVSLLALKAKQEKAAVGKKQKEQERPQLKAHDDARSDDTTLSPFRYDGNSSTSSPARHDGNSSGSSPYADSTSKSTRYADKSHSHNRLTDGTPATPPTITPPRNGGASSTTPKTPSPLGSKRSHRHIEGDIDGDIDGRDDHVRDGLLPSSFLGVELVSAGSTTESQPHRAAPASDLGPASRVVREYAAARSVASTSSATRMNSNSSGNGKGKANGSATLALDGNGNGSAAVDAASAPHGPWVCIPNTYYLKYEHSLPDARHPLFNDLMDERITTLEYMLQRQEACLKDTRAYIKFLRGISHLHRSLEAESGVSKGSQGVEDEGSRG